MAAVNDWDPVAKLNWIKVCLAGRAQKAFQGLPEGAKDMYDHVKAALMERFKPASKHELYNAVLQVRTRKPNEGWADFAEDLRRLTEKAFLHLDGRSHINTLSKWAEQPSSCICSKTTETKNA